MSSLFRCRAVSLSKLWLPEALDFSTVVAGGLSAAIRGAPLINIYNTFYRPMWWIYAKPEIRDVVGLKGKKVAVSGLADSSYIMLQEVLKEKRLARRRT